MKTESENERTPQPGDTMPDGTIFAGVSPDTGENMFATQKDLSCTLNWAKAMKHVADRLDAHGHRDWRVPTKAELSVLFEKRAKIGNFNESRSLDSWYWSSTEAPDSTDAAWMNRFSCGWRGWHWKAHDASVRPVRSEPQP